MKRYSELLTAFLAKGYQYDFFSNNLGNTGRLVLRHDIDFDIQHARTMSLVEDELGVKSTYFFFCDPNLIIF